MDHYIREEDKNMRELLEKIVAEESWITPVSPHNKVLLSSADLIYYFNEARKKCVPLTKGQPLYDLYPSFLCLNAFLFSSIRKYLYIIYFDFAYILAIQKVFECVCECFAPQNRGKSCKFSQSSLRQRRVSCIFFLHTFLIF
jgi:hypothetical protein